MNPCLFCFTRDWLRGFNHGAADLDRALLNLLSVLLKEKMELLFGNVNGLTILERYGKHELPPRVQVLPKYTQSIQFRTFVQIKPSTYPGVG